jgi:hypothetical protein
LLNGNTIGLHLPTGIIGTVIGHLNKVALIAGNEG